MKFALFFTTTGQILTILFLLSTSLFAQKESRVTFGVTGVVLKEDIATLYALKEQLEQETGFTIHLKIARTYEEMQALIKASYVDIAYVCGATYVELSHMQKTKLVAVPYLNGKNEYYSYILARKDSPYKSLNDFQGKLFAFSDPNSNSGAIAPSYTLLQSGRNPHTFFKEIIYTYDHGESIHALLDGFVEGAAVESFVYESFKKSKPKKAAKLKIIQKLGPYPAPPIIARENLDLNIFKKFQDAFVQMHLAPQGKKITDTLAIDSFSTPKNVSYDSIATMIDAMKKSGL